MHGARAVEGTQDQIDEQYGRYYERRTIAVIRKTAQAFDQTDEQAREADDEGPALRATEKRHDEGENDWTEAHVRSTA